MLDYILGSVHGGGGDILFVIKLISNDKHLPVPKRIHEVMFNPNEPPNEQKSLVLRIAKMWCLDPESDFDLWMCGD